MRIPRDLSGKDLIKLLGALGYEHVRTVGSHARCTEDGGRKITVPLHDSLRIGTLSAIVDQVALQKGMVKEEVVQALFGKKH